MPANQPKLGGHAVSCYESPKALDIIWSEDLPQPQPREWLWQDIVPAKEISIFFGKGCSATPISSHELRL